MENVPVCDSFKFVNLFQKCTAADLEVKESQHEAVGSICGFLKVRTLPRDVNPEEPFPRGSAVTLVPMTNEREYTVLDVFAERPFEGNPLAVIHDASGLSDRMMQSIAREMNLSETTFVLPDENPERDRVEGMRVRIFTTQEELPFGGHPTLGTASWLHLFHPVLQGRAEITLRLNVGPIPVRFEPGGSVIEGVFGTMRQNDPVFGAEHEPADIAAVLGLAAEDLLPGYAPQTVSTGNPFCIVALRSTTALSQLQIPQRTATVWLREHGVRWFYCIAPCDQAATAGSFGSAPATWRARMQFYSGEDPATGSAAGPCIAWLVQRGLAAAGQELVLEQGVEMGRPSRLTLRATKVAGKVGGVGVAGRTLRAATGRIVLPIHGVSTQREEP